MRPRLGQIATVLGVERRRPSSVASTHNSVLFRALARLPEYEDYVPVYFKVFDPKFQRKAFFNEILGHRAAQLVGLPTPADVKVCACRRDLVPSPSRALDVRSADDSPYLAGLASVDANPRGLIQIVGQGFSPRLRAELQAWPHLAEVAVLDELLLNVDRNYKNLHRVAAGDFVLIDHEKILGGVEWQLKTFREQITATSSANHIAGFIAEDTSAETQNYMMQVGINYARRLEFNEQSLGIECAQLDSLCHLKPGTTSEIIDLLDTRRSKLPELLFHHLKMAQLFQ